MAKPQGTGRGRKSGSASLPSNAIRNLIVAAVRRAWSIYSPERKAVLLRARRERLKTNKDGSISKKLAVTYVCAACEEEFAGTEVQVDHIEPVGDFPGFPPGTGRSWDDWLAALFCPETNLQVLCKQDHKEKSRHERSSKV